MFSKCILNIYDRYLVTRSFLFNHPMQKWVSSDQSGISLATGFSQKIPESSNSIYSSIFMLENI